MNYEVYRNILFAHIQTNSAKLIGWRFTVEMDNDPKHTVKATQEFFKAKRWNILQWPSQSPNVNPIKHAFHLLKTRLKAERQQTTTEDSCSQGLEKHHKGGNPAYGDVHVFQISDSHRLQRLLNKVLRISILFMIILICPITLGPLKWICMKIVAIPKFFLQFWCNILKLKLKVCTSIASWLFHFKSIVVAYTTKIIKIMSLSKYIYFDRENVN